MDPQVPRGLRRSNHGSNLVHSAERLECIVDLESFLRVTPLGVLLVLQGAEHQGVLLVDKVVQRTHLDAGLLQEAELHCEPLTAARCPHTVEARRQAPVSDDLHARNRRPPEYVVSRK